MLTTVHQFDARDSEFPKAILHIDGDAFFASCEVTRRPELKGKPVVVGAERGIATAFTYEAKALGVTRGMPIARVRRLFPDVIILPGDYALYAEMSNRMLRIVERYTPQVERYSIDECFADITGFHVPRKLSYNAMARTLKEELQSELGITFSFGLAPTKALAKVASKFRKPDGYTIIPVSQIEEMLIRVPIENVWGIGRKTSVQLKEDGITHALKFISKPKSWIAARYTKPYVELWEELRGESRWNVCSKKHRRQQSFMHTRTFTPPTSDRARLMRELARHTESVCRSAREEGLAARRVTFFLRTQQFKSFDTHIKLLNATNLPTDIISAIEKRIESVLHEGESYRATGVTLHDLVPEETTINNLFDVTKRSERLRKVYRQIDEVNERYGHLVVRLAASGREKPRQGDTELEKRAGHIGRQTKGVPFMSHD